MLLLTAFDQISCSREDLCVAFSHNRKRSKGRALAMSVLDHLYFLPFELFSTEHKSVNNLNLPKNNQFLKYLEKKPFATCGECRMGWTTLN